jgi:hypothetical protein
MSRARRRSALQVGAGHRVHAAVGARTGRIGRPGGP